MISFLTKKIGIGILAPHLGIAVGRGVATWVPVVGTAVTLAHLGYEGYKIYKGYKQHRKPDPTKTPANPTKGHIFTIVNFNT